MMMRIWSRIWTELSGFLRWKYAYNFQACWQVNRYKSGFFTLLPDCFWDDVFFSLLSRQNEKQISSLLTTRPSLGCLQPYLTKMKMLKDLGGKIPLTKVLPMQTSRVKRQDLLLVRTIPCNRAPSRCWSLSQVLSAQQGSWRDKVRNRQKG